MLWVVEAVGEQLKLCGLTASAWMLYAPSAHDSYPGTQKRRISGKDDFAVSRLSGTWPNVGFSAAAPPPQAEVTHSWHFLSLPARWERVGEGSVLRVKPSAH